MNHINLKANAKINLALDVLGKREDGYHDMKMVMQTLKLHDTIFIKKFNKRRIKLVTNLKWLPVDEKNLVHKAITLIQKNYNVNSGVFVEVTKNIPVSAGLAGGSADCAAALIGMRRLFNLLIPNSELLEMAKSLGADVPYCLMQGTALAEGIGEKLTKISPHPPVYVVLAKPNINVSTASVFKSLDLSTLQVRPDIDTMIKNIEAGNLEEISNGFCNVLETVTETNYPVIRDIKNIMVRQGAMGALMSGSGPTVFGYFKDKSDAYSAIRNIRLNVKNVREIYLTGIFNRTRRGKYE